MNKNVLPIAITVSNVIGIGVIWTVLSTDVQALAITEPVYLPTNISMNCESALGVVRTAPAMSNYRIYLTGTPKGEPVRFDHYSDTSIGISIYGDALCEHVDRTFIGFYIPEHEELTALECRETDSQDHVFLQAMCL